MPSSTSSSRLPAGSGSWLSAFVIACAVLAAFVVGLEWRLASAGFVPTAIDSEELWIKERLRASRLGDRALVLIGASRLQTGVDLAVLRSGTGLEPIQLAIDGSSSLPILEGLAKDPAITGTVVVDYDVGSAAGFPTVDAATRHQQHVEAELARGDVINFSSLDARLSDSWRSHLRSYADGARPVTALLVRAVAARQTPQYLVTLPDRSRLADYQRVSQPRFYLTRVATNLGVAPPRDDEDLVRFEKNLVARIDGLAPAPATFEAPLYSRMLAATRKIESRGGRVFFIVMPTSGLVRRIDEQRFPRDRFYDRFAAALAPRAFHWADSPALRGYTCPDGSHLDFRDRENFTRDLLRFMPLGSGNGQHGPATSPPAASSVPAAATRSP